MVEVNIDEVMKSTDGLWDNYANIPEASGLVGQIYQELLEKTGDEKEAHFRTAVYIALGDKAVAGFKRWGEAKYSS